MHSFRRWSFFPVRMSNQKEIYALKGKEKRLPAVMVTEEASEIEIIYYYCARADSGCSWAAGGVLLASG
jgi:hypothetical protein